MFKASFIRRTWVNNVHRSCLSLIHSPHTICWVQFTTFLFIKVAVWRGFPSPPRVLFLQSESEKSSKIRDEVEGERPGGGLNPSMSESRARAGLPLHTAHKPKCEARIIVQVAHACSHSCCKIHTLVSGRNHYDGTSCVNVLTHKQISLQLFMYVGHEEQGENQHC